MRQSQKLESLGQDAAWRARPGTEAKTMFECDLHLYEAIVRQMPDAVIFTDRDGIIRAWNPGAELLFGFAASEALGRSLDMIIPERLRPAHWAAFHRAIVEGRTRGGNQVRTTRSLHKDGRTLYVDLSFAVITDPLGAATGALAVGRDGSARYLAEKKLREDLQAASGDGAHPVHPTRPASGTP
jgi:PAS domain S-box-containing protein